MNISRINSGIGGTKRTLKYKQVAFSSSYRDKARAYLEQRRAERLEAIEKRKDERLEAAARMKKERLEAAKIHRDEWPAAAEKRKSERIDLMNKHAEERAESISRRKVKLSEEAMKHRNKNREYAEEIITKRVSDIIDKAKSAVKEVADKTEHLDTYYDPKTDVKLKEETLKRIDKLKEEIVLLTREHNLLPENRRAIFRARIDGRNMIIDALEALVVKLIIRLR